MSLKIKWKFDLWMNYLKLNEVLEKYLELHHYSMEEKSLVQLTKKTSNGKYSLKSL